MAVTAEEKVAYFESELKRIYDHKIREFTKLCIVNSPDYIFEDCPSSSTGKYHPVDELSYDGTIIHTKKVFTMAYEMVKALECEHNRDLVLSGCIIHDLRKKGVEGSFFTLKNHPALAADLVDEVQDATLLLTDEQHNILRNCVGYHYGPWSEQAWKKQIKDYTSEELAVFLSDFVVSKRFVQTDYRREY